MLGRGLRWQTAAGRAGADPRQGEGLVEGAAGQRVLGLYVLGSLFPSSALHLQLLMYIGTIYIYIYIYISKFTLNLFFSELLGLHITS